MEVAAVAVPASVLRSAASAVASEPGRRVWSADGRAQVEVWGLDGSAGARVSPDVQEALTGLAGTSWGQVDRVTRRVVVRFDPPQLDVSELVEEVAAGEQAAGVTSRGYRHREHSFPGDGEPVAMQASALAAEAVGLTAAVAGRLTRLPLLPGSTATAVVLADYQPRLRPALETRIGPTGTTLALATATVHGLTQGAPSLFVETGQRTQALLAGLARREAFNARKRSCTRRIGL